MNTRWVLPSAPAWLAIRPVGRLIQGWRETPFVPYALFAG